MALAHRGSGVAPRSYCYYNKGVEIGFDQGTNANYEADRLLSFERAADFEWRDTIITPDDRADYSESCLVAVGYLDMRLHVLCFTPVEGGIRVISFRKANTREARKHGKPLTIDR